MMDKRVGGGRCTGEVSIGSWRVSTMVRYIAIQRGSKDRLGFRKSLDSFGGVERGRARSSYWHGEERRPSTNGLISKMDCIIPWQKVRCPARTTVGSVEPIGAGLAEAGPEDNGVGRGGVNGAELLDVELFGQDESGAVTWPGRSVRWYGG